MRKPKPSGDPRPAEFPCLVCLKGKLKGEKFHIGKDCFIIGRQPASDLRIDEPQVSRRHAEIKKEGGEYLLKDLKSRNGTLLNGETVDNSQLCHRDQVRIVNNIFVFLREAESFTSGNQYDTSVIITEPDEGITIQLAIPDSDRTMVLPRKPFADQGFLDRMQRAMELLHHMAEVLSTDIDREALLKTILDMLLEAFDAERACVLLQDDGSSEMVPYSSAVRRSEDLSPLRLSRTIIELAKKEKTAPLYRDAALDPRLSGAQSVADLRIRSVMCVPLQIRGSFLGLLYLDNRSRSVEYRENDLRLLKTIAYQVALVIENFGYVSAMRNEVRYFKQQLEEKEKIVLGNSRAINRVVEIARKAADSEATVLVLGESGTGKEVLSRTIHRWSGRNGKPFVVVNCVALSSELLQSELFGHEKGAFTGAVRQTTGKLELAHGGTVFLDEIGEIKPEIQVKLLRFLQDREFERVGGNRPIKVDVRVIAATNRDLKKAMSAGDFREDLYYRLRVVEIKMPTLRERKEDIPLLAELFLEQFSGEAKKRITGFSRSALDKMKHYGWPGNIRELKNSIERAVVLCSGRTVELEDLCLSQPDSFSSPGSLETIGYHDRVKELKRRVILEALDKAGGVKGEAAKRLGLQLSYLSRLMKNLEMR